MKYNLEEYGSIVVESFKIEKTSGRHGNIHIRPIPNQEPFLTTLFVECSNQLKQDYPIGTRFRIKAKIIQKEDGINFVYSHYSWKFKVIKQ